ncbi:MAG: translocation/assembly module TamB domain-containing protein [Gemmatimonadota bacterium]
MAGGVDRPPGDVPPGITSGQEPTPGDDPPRARNTRRRPIRHVGRVAHWAAVLVGLASLAAAFALFFFTQTGRGRDFVTSALERKLAGGIHGTVRLGPILAGNLITRIVLERFEISGADGEPFVALDTVRLEYDPFRFLRNNFTLRRVEVARLDVRLHQYPEGDWNFDRILGGSPPDGPAGGKPAKATADSAGTAGGAAAREGGGALRLALNDLMIGSGHLEIRWPWGGGLSPARREAAGRAALRGGTVWRVERVGPGRYEQVAELDSLHGGFPLLRLRHPRLPFRIELQQVSATAKVVRKPLEFLRFDGSVTFADTIRAEIREARLPSTRLTGRGWLLPGSPLGYRFDLNADPIGFSDLQWLSIPLPEDGGGPMGIVLRSRGATPLVEVKEGRARVDDTEMRGSFTLALGPRPRFEALNLRFRPLRLSAMDHLLGRPELIDGYLSGTVSGAGPVDSLAIDGDVTLRDVAGAVEPSRLKVKGGVSLVAPHPVTSLRLALEEFEPRWARVLGLSTGLGGRTRGTLSLDRRPGGRLTFQGDLFHSRAGDTTSHVIGGGTVDLAAGSEVDVRVQAAPLSLSLLDPYFPELHLVGAVRGPIAARGRLADLDASADLQTPRGLLTFDGHFDLEGAPRRYDAEVVASGIELDQWARGAPDTKLAVRGHVSGAGTDPATLRARFDLQILPSVFQKARVDTSLLRFTLARGLATVDTFAISTDVGRVRGRGSFGLVNERSGALIFDVEAPDLSAWDRWFQPAVSDLSTIEAADVFSRVTALPGRAGRHEEGRGSAASGALTARGVLFGNVGDFSFGGQLVARSPRFHGHRADSLVATLDVADPASFDSVVANLRAWNVSAGGLHADSVRARLERAGSGSGDVRLNAARDSTVSVALHAGVEWSRGRYAAALDQLLLHAGSQSLALADSTHLVYGDSGLFVRDLTLRGAGGASFHAAGSIPARGEATFDVAFARLDLSQLLKFLPDPPPLSGHLDGALSVRSTAESPSMEARIQVRRPGLKHLSYRGLDAELRYVERALRGRISLLGPDGRLAGVSGTVRSDLSLRRVERRLLDDPLDLRVQADSLPLELLELATGSLERVSGVLRGAVEVSGAPGALRFRGDARLEDGRAWDPALGIWLQEAFGEARFEGSRARVDSLALRSGGGGRLRAAGFVDLSELTNPRFALDLEAKALHAIDRRAMSFLMDGRGRLGGAYAAPELSGRFRFRSGDIRQDEWLRQREVIDLTDPDVYSLIDTTAVAERRLLERVRNPFMQNLRLDVRLDAGPDLWLRSDVLDVEVGGDGLEVHMNRSAQSVSMIGTVRLLRGTYRFDRLPPYSQQLRISSGTIEFVGTPGMNPNIQITAEYRTRTPEGPVTVVAVLSGTMLQTELHLQSDPPLDESDMFCFLALGSPCFAAVDRQLGSRLVRESVLGTLGSELSTALVGDVGLDYLSLRSNDYGYDAGTSQSLFAEGLFANTEVELGKYLGRGLFVTVTQPFGNRFPGASVEWRFSEDWTLEARTENRFGRLFQLPIGSGLEFDRTYGLFLFREWSF